MKKFAIIIIFLILCQILIGAKSTDIGYAFLGKIYDSQPISQKFTAEDCSLDPGNKNLPKGLEDGDQIRVFRHDKKDFVLYTVHLFHENEFNKDRIRMNELGMKRLGYKTAKGQKLKLVLPVIKENLTKMKAEKSGEMYEYVKHYGKKNIDKVDFLFVQTPHGGDIEYKTDYIGKKIAASKKLKNSVVLWGCEGFSNPKDPNPIAGYNRWHITSTAISENSFPKLGKLVSSGRMFDHAISIHGYRGNEILIGGRGSLETKIMLKEAFKEHGINIPSVVVESDGYLSGFSLSNIVNRYSSNGIQIEFPKEARLVFADQIASAIIDVYSKIKKLENNNAEFKELEAIDTLTQK